MERELHRRFKQLLLRLPDLTSMESRTALMLGIPSNIISSLNRTNNPAVDIDRILAQLDQLGRLSKTGERPLIIVAQNAYDYVAGSSVGESIQEIIQELERYYDAEEPSDTLPAVPERLIFEGRDWRLPFSFIERARQAARCVARLAVPRIIHGRGTGTYGFGTGWLVAPGLVLTNHHVVEARGPSESAARHDDFRAQAEQTIAWFDYHEEGGARAAVNSVALLKTSSRFDYALLRMEDSETLLDREQLTVVSAQPILPEGSRLNILQHPKSGALRYAIRNNFYVGQGDQPYYLRYLTDTEPGASGSPVLDDQWQVVAMHHAWREVPKEEYKGEIVKYHNQGIAVHAILGDLSPSLLPEIQAAQRWR